MKQPRPREKSFGGTRPRHEAVALLVKEFNKVYPGIKVEHFTAPPAPDRAASLGRNGSRPFQRGHRGRDGSASVRLF